MKNKKRVIIFLVIFVIVIVAVVAYILINKQGSYKVAKGLVKLDLKSEAQYDIDLEHLQVFNNYADFSLYFDNKNKSEADFDNNNYAVIILTYDDCSFTNVVPTKYKIHNETIDITAYHDGCSSCPPLYAYYAVKVDKNISSLTQYINWIVRNEEECN